jgi:hypothetical protein
VYLARDATDMRKGFPGLIDRQSRQRILIFPDSAGLRMMEARNDRTDRACKEAS